MIARGPERVNSGLAYPLQGWSAAGGQADETERKRTIGRRSSAIGGIAVVAGGEPDSLLLAKTGPKDERIACRFSGTVQLLLNPFWMLMALSCQHKRGRGRL